MTQAVTQDRRPDLFIVGAPKSGTSSLYEYLSGHPQVFMSSVKEPHYFCPDVQISARRRLRHGTDETQYLKLFEGAAGARRAGEASTRYLGSPLAPGLVKAFQPDARIVAALRNPVEMVQALHNERVSNLNEDIVDFEAALSADDDRRAGRRLPKGSNALGAVYRDSALYAQQLERWIAEFGRERVHVIVFDDFAANTEQVFSRLLKFLEVDDGYRPASFAVHNARSRQRRGFRRIADSRVGRLMTTSVASTILGSDGRARLARRFRTSRVARASVERAAMRDETRRELERFFAADVQQLSVMLDRDLTTLWFGPTAQSRTNGMAA